MRQAGAIAFRPSGSTFEILLVTAKRDPSAWIFPKGHIEPGESSSEAALRETREEAGVLGRVIGPAGRPLEFESKGEDVAVQYFLLEATGETTPLDSRGIRWVPREAATAAVTHRQARALLERVLPEIVRHLSGTR